MSLGYTASQLLRYHKHCKTADPTSRVLPPGGREHWDDMSVREWLCWFGECLTRKVTRGTEAKGKGNRASKRAWEARKRAISCSWCGAPVGDMANPNASHNYCAGCQGMPF